MTYLFYKIETILMQRVIWIDIIYKYTNKIYSEYQTCGFILSQLSQWTEELSNY